MDHGQTVIDGFFRRRLEVFVDRQYEIIARHGAFSPEALHGLARDIDLDLVAAILATHIRIIDFLEAEFADDVTGLVALILLVFELLIIDLADVAECVRAFLLQHVVADRLVLDHDARVEIFLFFDNGNDVRRHVRLDADRIKAAVRGDLFLDVLDRHVHERRHARDDIILDRRRQRQERHREARPVRHEELPIAVVKRAARRHGRDDADAVAVREPCVIVPVINLKIPGAADEHGDDEHHEIAEDAKTGGKPVVPFVFDQNISPRSCSCMMIKAKKAPQQNAGRQKDDLRNYCFSLVHSLTRRVSTCTG